LPVELHTAQRLHRGTRACELDATCSYRGGKRRCRAASGTVCRSPWPFASLPAPWPHRPSRRLRIGSRRGNARVSLRKVSVPRVAASRESSRFVSAVMRRHRAFGRLTDEPFPKQASPGQDRRLVPVKSKTVDALRSPDLSDLIAMYAIPDDRVRPYYEHRLAA
jgi:hypothetical protein